MNSIRYIAVSFVLGLAGCASESVSTGPNSETFAPLPDAVLAIAAPSQNLQAARLDPDDGCYWYRHTGPVETTWLPLRTAEGNPICARQPES